jgi:capsular polysaccharide biosynthesis protein
MEITIQSYRKLFQDEQMVSLANPEVVNVLIIEKAVAPTRPGHSRLFYIVLATIGGLLVSFAICFIKEYFDHRVTDPQVASQLLGVPTLGSIEKA